jgi:large repetitive protein
MSRVVPRSLAGLACALALPGIITLSACAIDTAPVALKQAPAAPRHTVSSTVTVTNTNATGTGSLADAVANAADGATIGFDPSLAGQTITLTSALSISHGVTIEGPNPGGITVSGGGTTQIISTAAGTYSVTLRNITLTGGLINTGGGAIANNATLTLDHTLVTGNTACVGGGVYNLGTVTVTNSTISGNTAAPTCGGNGLGGGIASEGPVTLVNTTLANNSANTAGAALWTAGAITLQNSIITNDCVIGSGVTETLTGTNLSDGTCGSAGAHMLVANPQLGSLAANGGPTKTMALLKTSPAIDAATACSVSTDQRYVTRPQGAACDIGAYEFNNFELTPLTISDAVTVNPSTGAAVVTGTISCPEAFSLTVHVVLSQPQKAGRVNTSVTAAGDLAFNCTAGTQLWAIAVSPASGTFQNGAGSVSANTTGMPAYVLPATSSAAVKLYWGHK